MLLRRIDQTTRERMRLLRLRDWINQHDAKATLVGDRLYVQTSWYKPDTGEHGYDTNVIRTMGEARALLNY